MSDQKLILWAGVLVIKEQRVLVIKETDKDFYLLPGGKLEVGESDEQAAVREVLEELGVAIELKDLYTEITERSKATGQMVRFRLFKAELAKIPDEQNLPGKTERIVWVDSAYVQEGLEVGNLLKHIIPMLVEQGLID